MDSIAFTIFGKPIHWYGLMMAAGFLAAYLVAHHRAKTIGFPPEYVADSLMLAVVGGLFGARSLYLISYWDDYIKACEINGWNPYVRMVFVHEGGLVFIGGFIGAALAVYLMARFRKLEASKIADFAALGVPLGHAFGRIGCFMTACCHGIQYDGFGAIRYPVANYVNLARGQFEHHLIEANATTCAPLFPAQLLASVSNLLIFAIILVMMRLRVCKKSGQLFGVYLMLYSISRFLNEMLRGDYDSAHRHAKWLASRGLSDAQMLMPVIFIAGLVVFFLTKRFAPDAPVPIDTTDAEANGPAQDEGNGDA